MDSVTALTYINKRGGCHSLYLTQLAKRVWEWCIERRITLVAEHIPGKRSTIADSESHMIRNHWDWKLNPVIFSRIQQRFGPLQIDLFPSWISAQLPRFFSWSPDPQAEATDAFLQSWEGRNYASLLWALIPCVLLQVRTQQADLILVAPAWKACHDNLVPWKIGPGGGGNFFADIGPSLESWSAHL